MIEATDAHVWTARRRCLSPAARVLAVMEAGRAHSGGRGAGEGLSADAVAAVAASVAAAAAAVPTVGGGAPFADEADAHFGVRVSARALCAVCDAPVGGGAGACLRLPLPHACVSRVRPSAPPARAHSHSHGAGAAQRGAA
jgi:hypothetical protein